MSRVHGAALFGVEGVAVEVEVRISSLLPRVDIVGLPEAAVRESAARVRAAVGAIGADFPDRRVTVSLAPASLRKSGAGLDLPIAIGILAAAGALGDASLDGLALLGELALDGRLRPVRGALALALAVRDAGCRRLIVPLGSAAEAALAPDLEVLVRRGPRGGGAAPARGGAASPRAVPADLTAEPDRPAGPRARCAGRSARRRRSRSPPPAGTRCCCEARPAAARPCSRSACAACSRRSPSTRRSR